MIYYDITDLLDHFRRSLRVGGIARVSTATIARFREISQQDEFCLIAWHPGLRKVVVADPQNFPCEAEAGPSLCAYFGLPYKGPHPLDAYLARRYRKPFQRFLNKWRLIASNKLTKGKTFRRKGVGALNPDAAIQSKAQWRSPEFAPGDIVFIAAGTRGFDAFNACLEKARREQGVRLAQLLHDILPVSDPQFFLQGHPLLFADWLVRVNRTLDLLVVTTEATGRDFAKAMKERGQTPAPYRVVPLAHEFVENAEAASAPIYEQVSTPVLLAARLPYVLCVGTREIRKNHLALARVWQSLQRKHGVKLPRLIFAGRQGWMNEEFDRLLQRTGNLDDQVKLVESPSNEELAYLYKNCLFSVFPSFCEGWGLPIGESLWFDRPVVTSNCSSMPEVAGPYADYADPFDLAELEAAIEKMLDVAYRGERIEAIKAMPKRRWQDFSDDLWREILLAKKLGAQSPDA